MASRRGRHRLLADIEAASLQRIPNVQEIVKGDARDEFDFTFMHLKLPLGRIKIQVMPQEVDAYPGDHFFFVDTKDDVPPSIIDILQDAMLPTPGLLIADLVKTLSEQICAALDSTDDNDSDDNLSTTDNSLDEDLSDMLEDDEGLLSNDNHLGSNDPLDDISTQTHTPIPSLISQRIREDFRAVKDAGFKVGMICGGDSVPGWSIATMSVSVRKLGLSEKTLNAWNLDASDFAVLLMRFKADRYPSFDEILKVLAGQMPLKFKLRKCTEYRPTLAEATSAFAAESDAAGFAETQSSEHSSQESVGFQKSPAVGGKLSTFGVGDSIERLLNDSFIAMAKLRHTELVSWDDAMVIHSHLMRSIWGDRTLADAGGATNIANIAGNDTNPSATSSYVAPNDHLSSRGQISLPLVAMQFALRYLVKCTEYCLICHQKVTDDFDALKPYVCRKPLCLFQYMSIGLGPSLDQEIIDQEYVVDLLISFFYASAASYESPSTLREFPVGLDLQVPRIVKEAAGGFYYPSDIAVGSYGLLVRPMHVKVAWDLKQAEVIHQNQISEQELKTGQWVLIYTKLEHPSVKVTVDVFHHARIDSISGSLLKLHFAHRHSVPVEPQTDKIVQAHDWSIGITQGNLVPYCQDLDYLSDVNRAFSAVLLLNTLPSVAEMKAYLTGGLSRQLATWDRIPHPARKLLRWIIASNRSFIVQLDNPDGKSANSSGTEAGTIDRSREKILGIDGWFQFRFAQGSPEKEARFQAALKDVKSKYRTILAWHGSGVSNWHSIIRHGLDFKTITNGRSYGHGVYLSRSFDYSLHFSSTRNQTVKTPIWPQSALQITQAISVNELVNLPHKFKHSISCYVVDKLHWIQCRYLLVRPENPIEADAPRQLPQDPPDNMPAEFRQDPRYAMLGPNYSRIFVPSIAIPTVEEPKEHQEATAPLGPEKAKEFDSDYEEYEEDIKFLNCKAIEDARKVKEDSKTDFRPGTLDFSRLPQLAPPTTASNLTLNALQRELRKLEKVQSTTPLSELGWYVELEKVTNLFQWIVELHSFDPDIPLARDMKKAGVTSIVIDIRFLQGYPFTPPFIRVIQPRFLPFAAGGGGHVTTGGALCMELLTNTGWSPACSMESVLLQIRLAMCSQDPRPARLDLMPFRQPQYSIREAVEAYKRAAENHGWEVPPELNESVT
ncbi:hypothetical protein GGS21DRAFT_298361 [Xylaria nigripes]|nr:hypothetical protein GGS21DRAFT_298361 [Xylaria nigripes]